MTCQKRLVVEMSAAVIAKSRNVRDLGLKVDQRKIRQLGIAFESDVEVGHVSIVVLSVMNFHRLCVDVRLESGRERIPAREVNVPWF